MSLENRQLQKVTKIRTVYKNHLHEFCFRAYGPQSTALPVP